MYNISKPKKIELAEVKKNEVGTGLLIETDGHILAENDTVKQIQEDITRNKTYVIPDRFIVSAVFQKYGIKNANGRIYPEKILKREVEKYIKNKVNQRCSIGALDHPSCQLADTRILTKTGWKFITEVKEGEDILTLNKNENIEIHPVLHKIEEHYKGKLIHIKGRYIDIKVTPNHKFLIYDKTKTFKGFYTAQDLLTNSINNQSNCYLKKVGEWNNNSETNFTLKPLTITEIEIFDNEETKKLYSEELHIPMDVWMKFIAIYLTKGKCYYDGKRGEGCITISENRADVCDEIEELLYEFPIDSHTNCLCNGSKTYYLYDIRLAKYLQENIDFNSIPFEIKNQGKDMLKTFYDWFILCYENISKRNDSHIYNKSSQFVLDLNEIQFKIGYSGLYQEKNGVYGTMKTLNKYISLNSKTLSITEEDYDGFVYCVEVENHNFYTMCNNGKCLWSGNSTMLSGHDVTHVITKLEWIKNTLVGELELHLSPGYRKYGICSTSGDFVANMLLDGILIGVSSRAIGSVENKLGSLVVGDDLDLISWDVVVEPSTPGAFIGNSIKEIEQFIETDQSKEDKPQLNEKIEKINKILS